jgi:hypothetical protein
MGFADPPTVREQNYILAASDESQTGGSGSVTHYQTGEFHDLFVRRAGGETQIVVIEPF